MDRCRRVKGATGPEIPVMNGERMLWEMCMDPVNPKIIAVPDLEIPMILDGPEEMAAREGTHERIQAEIYHDENLKITIYLFKTLILVSVPHLIIITNKELLSVF